MRKRLKTAERLVISYFRKLYQQRLILRCAVLTCVIALYFLRPQSFSVLRGTGFFKRFSLLHVLWGMWVIDMALQLSPAGKYWPLGSQKFLKRNFRRIADALLDRAQLKAFLKKSMRDTLLVGLVWTAIMAAALALHHWAGFGDAELLVLTVVFYVCDVICVLYWCPFRVWIMKNRCCTTCRIFNWDHIMMFSPLLLIPGVYTWSLCAMALAVFAIWEITFYLHPERFWEDANENLRCSNCTDVLCGKRNCNSLP